MFIYDCVWCVDYNNLLCTFLHISPWVQIVFDTQKESNNIRHLSVGARFQGFKIAKIHVCRTFDDLLKGQAGEKKISGFTNENVQLCRASW